MTNLLRSELLKFRTLRSNVVLVSLMVLAGLVPPLLGASLSNPDESDAGRLLVEQSFSGLLLFALLIGGMAAATIATEHRHHTIRVTYCVTPVRSKVLLGKTFVALALASAIGIVSVVVAPLAALAIMRSRGGYGSVRFPDGSVEQFIGGFALLWLMALLGLAIGMITRSVTFSSLVLVLWPLVVEMLVAAAVWAVGLGDIQEWMPFQVGFSLLPDSGGQFGTWGSIGYFGAWVGALTAIGWVTQQRRDA
jgi:ABC-2 type transport system permease protein